MARVFLYPKTTRKNLRFPGFTRFRLCFFPAYFLDKGHRMISRFVFVLFSIFASTMAFAEDAAVPAGAPAGAPPPPGTGAMLVPFIAMFGIMYLFMIRPQQKKMKAQNLMLSQLKEGDEVLTASGILGTVKGIADRMVTLEIDKDVSMKVLKTQVAHVLKGDLPADKLA
jgi:preprotein translocase subunit YajC